MDLQKLIVDIAKDIVDKPEFVTVTVNENEDSIVYVLNVHQDDMGLVIGKHGKIAKSIRSVVKAATMKNEKPVFVEII